ncbi:monovalent cation/H+ antiporter complex subunit F [Litorivivens sp.]|uniref:monovalent cation/H+ antiporter complex subunit F n=1 Tax=Litorivivens sp. TaxID=2020868 RepID=UPI0035696295
MVLTVVAIALIVVMAMAIARALLGPTIYDRILAVNLFGTKTVLLIAVVSYIVGRPDFLDVALIYALINFISVIAVLRFFEYGSDNVSDKVGEDG